MTFFTDPAKCWYFCAASMCTSDDRKRGKHGYMQTVHFHTALAEEECELCPSLASDTCSLRETNKSTPHSCNMTIYAEIECKIFIQYKKCR